MVKRKVQKKPLEDLKEVVRQRKPKVKVDMGSLPDLVVEGKVTAPLGTRLYFERIAPKGKTAIHTGFLRGVNDSNGMVEIWDETVEQFYCFSLKQRLPVVKTERSASQAETTT